MQAVRNIIRITPQITKTIVPQRSMSAVSTPARNKVSNAELMFLASVMVVGWSAIPAWVLVNIKNYRQHE